MHTGPYFSEIATKLSNFAAQQQTFEASVELYKNSFKEMQTDYIDYLLLHSISSGLPLKSFLLQ